MTPERHRRITDVFLQASHQQRNTRARFIEDTCREDGDLRREVEALLAADEHAHEFLEGSADDIAVDLLNTLNASLVGQQLGEYQVVDLLSAGGMGEVFLAHDTRLVRRAALKILPQEYTVDPLRCSHLEEEARAIAALNHPNIITIYGIGQAGSRSFLATEFVEGQTVRAMLQAGPLSPEFVIDIAVQALTSPSLTGSVTLSSTVWPSSALADEMVFSSRTRIFVPSGITTCAWQAIAQSVESNASFFIVFPFCPNPSISNT